MAVNLSPVFGVAGQLFNNNGDPLAGGKIFTYLAGTTTPATTYTTSAGIIAHTNPIVLDGAGRVPSGEIWLTDGIQYKFVVQDAANNLIGTYDNLSGINSNFVNFTNQQEIQTATAGQTVFNLTTMQYQPGTNSLSVFVDGVNQYGPGAQYAYVETDEDTVTFVSGLHVGANVKFTTSQLNTSGGIDAQQVSYNPPYVDAVATNVEAKLAENVSVKDFGAVGDGTTDNLAAFQKAVDALAGTGGTLYVPGGEGENQYLFKTQLGPNNPTIELPSDIHIVIDDDVYLLSEGGVASGANGYNQVASTQRALFVNDTTSTGNVNISITGGNIKSVASTAVSGAFISLQNVKNVKISNVKLWDVNGACRLQLSYCKDAILNNILCGYENTPTAPYSFEDGIRIGSGCNGAVISNCVLNSGDDAIAINNEPAETQNALTSTSGFAYNAFGASIQNVNIVNCQITTLGGNAIRIYNEATMTVGTIGRIQIDNISAYPANTGVGNNCISIEDFNSRSAINYVKLNNIYLSCLNNSGGAGINLVYADNVTITNSAVINAAVYGILCGNSVGTKISNCQILSTVSVDAVGFFAGCSASTITNSTINGTVRDGIHIECNECVVIGNILGNIGRSGVYLDGSAQHTNIASNRIATSTGAAIRELAGCDYTTCHNNDVVTSTTIDIATAGNNSVYEGNIGFNPVGSFTVGGTGSPMTLTADRTATMFTIAGGTVSSITVGGVITGFTSGSFVLPANTSMVVGYSVSPTMTKTVF
jgi:polygalacturonase